MFKKLDTNGDGKIDASELQAALPKDWKGKDATAIMKEADSNGDGSIDTSENDAFLTKMESQSATNGTSQAGGTPPSGGPPPGGGPRGGGAKASSTSSSSSSASTVYDSRDTNKDGKVSFEEMLAALEKESENTTVSSTKDDSSDSQSTFLKKLEEQMNRLTQSVQTYTGQGTGSDLSLGGSLDRMA
jgi:Ca2+-binding EF-hand superfamily protein